MLDWNVGRKPAYYSNQMLVSFECCWWIAQNRVLHVVGKISFCIVRNYIAFVLIFRRDVELRLQLCVPALEN